MTLKKEQEYVKNQLSKIKQKKLVQLLLFVDKDLAGASEITMDVRVQDHVGTLGISVAKKYRGKGLGKLLMGKVLSEANLQLKSLKIVILGVFAYNKRAQKMYKSFGFKEYGRLPDGIQYRGTLCDDLLMYKRV